MFFANLMKNANFEEMQKVLSTKGEWDLCIKEIYGIGINEENILAYYSCVFLLNSNEDCSIKAQLHYISALILTMGINHINGAYTLGAYHLQQAIKLDPLNIQYKEYFLSTFAKSPEIDIEPNIINRIANEILSIDPTNSIALRSKQR